MKLAKHSSREPFKVSQPFPLSMIFSVSQKRQGKGREKREGEDAVLCLKKPESENQSRITAEIFVILTEDASLQVLFFLVFTLIKLECFST